LVKFPNLVGLGKTKVLLRQERGINQKEGEEIWEGKKGRFYFKVPWLGKGQGRGRKLSFQKCGPILPKKPRV